jgi:hypothetical protein
MKNLLYYRPRLVNAEENHRLPGIKKFEHFFKLFAQDVVIVDRTGALQVPVAMKVLFPLPKLRPITKSYEEICNERAIELLNKADTQGVRLYIFYSGGIDSTLILVSLLKNATQKQKENITVLLSQESILENPNFYREHIEGKLKVESSVNFPYILGTDVLLVTGEHNDQLFGSDMVGKLMRICGEDVINKPYDRELFIRFFDSIEDNHEVNVFYVDLFEKLKAHAPVAIQTNFHFLWWINFSLKWQAVFMRTLAFTAERNIGKITPEYIEKNYCTFYGTEDFQLWSMNNLDKKIKDTWNSYKWLCKDIIYEYTKDADYRDNKTKVGSLSKIMIGNGSANFVDENYTFYQDLAVEEYYNKENDFI